MGNDEASCEENITMAEHQCNAKQQQPNIDGSYEQIMANESQVRWKSAFVDMDCTKAVRTMRDMVVI